MKYFSIYIMCREYSTERIGIGGIVRSYMTEKIITLEADHMENKEGKSLLVRDGEVIASIPDSILVIETHKPLNCD